MRKPLIAGNWKMYKTTAEAISFADSFTKLYKADETDVRAAICAPFTQLAALKEAFAGTGIMLGAQNVHFAEEGAFTGEISVRQLEEIGVDFCIVGHSERRQYFGETNETVNRKLHKLFETDITPIMCVGEGLAEREAGQEQAIVRAQIIEGLAELSPEQVARIVIAYEPIWAIGTGKTATPQQADQMCGFIREVIAEVYDDDTACEVVIQYGGSVKPANAAEIMSMAEIDGALVGGASLVPEEFIQIVDF